MSQFARAILTIPAIIALTACASFPGSPSAADERPDARNYLERERIENFTSAYQAVQTLRSRWLIVRVRASFQTQGTVWVYRDGVRVGGANTLERMHTMGIESIEYYDGIRASQRWGLGHENGVIYVTSRMR